MVVLSGAARAARPVADVVERLRAGGPAVVALSGGVDSGLVAALAYEALGVRTVAVTLTGSAVAAREVERARELAAAVGIEHLVVLADPLAREEYRANRSDRCYHCRSVEAGAVVSVATARGMAQRLDGIHLDDLSDDRPGLRAMDQAGFTHPLVWAGWTKADVRREARERGLPNWDRPSDACLASRVARGTPIDAELLRRIEAAESVLLARGFRRVRVRVHGPGARVEVDPDEVARFAEPGLRQEIVVRLRELGFEPVSIDPRGYHAAGAEIRVVA